MELLILSLHMIGDFVTQNNRMAQLKFSDWRWRTIHVVVYTLPFCGLYLIAPLPWWAIIAVFVAHWITDCRRWASGEEWAPKPIMVDQSLHIAQLAIIFWLAGIR